MAKKENGRKQKTLSATVKNNYKNQIEALTKSTNNAGIKEMKNDCKIKSKLMLNEKTPG